MTTQQAWASYGSGRDIDAQTRLVGVMGWPVEHSLSPAMHNAALHTLGLNWRYVALPVHPTHVKSAVGGLLALGFCGANVTVPHKRAVVPVLDYVAPEAAALDAVNTIVISRDAEGEATLSGYNTDVAGFLGALREGGFDPAAGGTAVVIGAGGAARAVVYGLLTAGMRVVTVLNRTVSRARALVADLQNVLDDAGALHADALDDDRLLGLAGRADLLVNATTVGMWPKVAGSIWPEGAPVPNHLAVYDLVYNPLETQLLRQTRGGGAHAIDGLGMLARQGALALSYWVQQPIDVDEVTQLMRRAAERALH